MAIDDNGTMRMTLPWPPSVNHYWRQFKGRMLISAEGRAYRHTVCILMLGVKPMKGQLAVSIEAYPPDNRRRDVDNLFKGLLDAMQHAGVYEDDSQISELSIKRKQKCDGGEVVVTVWRS